MQEEVICNVLNRQDSLVIMPTGGGKSLCYQLPALGFSGLTIVVSPLIALMKDQVVTLQANGIKAEFLNSSLNRSEMARIEEEAMLEKLKILYVAPERLSSVSFRELLPLLNVSLFAIDEAHCISEWGHDFRPEYRNLKSLRQQFSSVPIIALTATATPRVQEDIIRQLNLRGAKEFVSSFDRQNLFLRVERKKNSFSKLLNLLEQHRGESAIVYCFSRKDTEEIAEDLKDQGFNALPYHAGLDPETRKKHQELFITDEVPIIVATIAFGMGIDKPNIRLVVHHTFPKTVESYYQEVGRAGRDGLPSECVMFYSYGDKMKHEFFIDKIANAEEQDQARAKLNQVINYCDLQGCRRQYVLGYFGEKLNENSCQACDYCQSPKNLVDVTTLARNIFLCVRDTGNRFGKKYIAEIVAGQKTTRMAENRHHELSVFSSAGNTSMQDIILTIDLMIQKGLLRIKEGKYPILLNTSSGLEWFNKSESLVLEKVEKQNFDIEKRPSKELTEVTSFDQGLFDELRGLRKQLADGEGVPPFVVFGDVSLREMASYYPVDSDNFSRIHGVGEQKLNQYAEIFTSVIENYLADHGMAPIEVPKRKRPTVKPRAKRNSAHYSETKQMLAKGLPLAEIAKARGLTERTILTHVERLIENKVCPDVSYLALSLEGKQKIDEAIAACGDQRLRPIYIYLEKKFSYDEIRLVLLLKQAGMS